MKEPSNAKINLNLKILKKENGYHLIDSIFVPIDIYDNIEIIESEKDEIIGFNFDMNNNIIFKAVCLIREKYNIEKKFRVIVDKKIPMQAGLGGGSGNGAIILKMLNKMLELNLSNDELMDIGLILGSDVPFFIKNVPSHVSGRGEKIEEIKKFNCIYGVVVFDNLHFSTKQVYDTYDQIIEKGNYNNDLEAAALLLPGGERIKSIEQDLINNGAYMASLTGSGGAIFGLFKDRKEANVVKKKIKNKYAFVESFESIQ